MKRFIVQIVTTEQEQDGGTLEHRYHEFTVREIDIDGAVKAIDTGDFIRYTGANETIYFINKLQIIEISFTEMEEVK